MAVRLFPVSLWLLLLSVFPMIGSRSLGSGISVVSLDTEGGPSSTISDGGASAASNEEAEQLGVNIGSSNVSSAVTTTPCSLVTMSLLNGRDGKLMAYDDKTLITVSHDVFDVSQGVVPTIVYQVVLEIPSGHEFSLEFWLNGLTEERSKQKRRHQRDRRDTLLELYPQQNSHSSPSLESPTGSSSSSSNSGNSRGNSFNDPFVFCNKGSLAGVNREASAKQLKFHWYVNGNNLIPQASVSGLPSNVIFRLRFRSVVEATTSVFEQNLSVIVRSDCYLQLKVEDKTKLTLDSLWNPKTDNTGLNCTVFIVPKKNFGLEIGLSSLSVYGMRDICKGRYLQFTKSSQVSSSSSLTSFPMYSSSSLFDSSKSARSSSTVSTDKKSDDDSDDGGGGSSNTSQQQKYLTNNNFLENIQESRSPFNFRNTNNNNNNNNNAAQEPHPQQQQYSALQHKFCGKLEDYSENERTLTFLSSESAMLSTTSSNLQDGTDNEITFTGSSSSSSRSSDRVAPNQRVWGVYLTVRLPVAVKAREVFAFDLTALSPCQRVTLNGLDGQLQYSKHYENDMCSVVIHVPYGNIILAQIAVSSRSISNSNGGRVPQTGSGSSSTTNTEGDNNGGAPSSTNHRASNNNVVVQSDFITSASKSVMDDVILATTNLAESSESRSDTPAEDVLSSGIPLESESTADNNKSGRGDDDSNGGGGGGGATNNVRNDSVPGLDENTSGSSSSSSGNDNISSYTTGHSAVPTEEEAEVNNGNVGSRNSDVVKTSHHESQLELYDNGNEILDNSIPISSSFSAASYECPVNANQLEVEESNDINSAANMDSEGVNSEDDGSVSGAVRDSSSNNGGNGKIQQQNKQHKYLLIQAMDLVSGSEFNWCFDASKQNSAHKRAWKSSGNRVSINFRMSYFDTFILTYKSVKIPELAGDCERGWVKLDGACVTVMERAMRWTDAEESCQMNGGHLATVRNDQNEIKLGKLIAESPLFNPTRAYWIGANDRESEGNFQWTSGLPFQYKNWFPGWTREAGHQGKSDRSDILSAQPNDDGWSGQDCVEIRQIVVPQHQQQQQQQQQSSSASAFSSSTSDNNAFAPFLVKSDIRGTNPRTASAALPSGAASAARDRGRTSQFVGQGLNSQQDSNSKFFWNDRNCDVNNFYLCEKGTHQNVHVSCNRTLKLSPPQVTSMVVTSPAYPSPYPDNIVCVTNIETIPGFKLVLSFDEFILEDSPSCQYDSLEILELQSDSSTSSSGTSTPTSQQSNGMKQQQQQKTSRANSRVNYNNGSSNNNNKAGKKICGDWTKKLKLLRYTTASKSTQVILKFESDFSHHFPGFKVKVTVEKDMDQQCNEQHMRRFGNHCYLAVSFPAVTWSTAHQICETLKGNLASILSATEWGFLTQTLLSAPDYDKKSIYWLGGSIDQNNQLGWVDHMPFNFSGFHQSDLQTRYDFRCLSVYWHESGGGKGDLAWRLTECSQTAGYICKKRAQVEMRQILNRTFSGSGGKLASPNYPSNYVNNMDHRNHLVAPKSRKIVIRFLHMDVEPQENCLYDYIEIVDGGTPNRTRFCGSYQKDELQRLDYVSSSNEVDVIFHTDFSNTFTGYELLWRAVDVTSCVSGKTIMAEFVGSPFPLEDQTIRTPNFPYFNLPHLDCVYHIIAPAGQRLWLSFQVFELGESLSTSSLMDGQNSGGDGKDGMFGESTQWTGMNCRQQDHVSIDLTGGQHFSPSSSSSSSSSSTTFDGKLLSDLANDNEILICGNLSSTPFRVSFISYSERVAIRVRSPQGRTGRGFSGRFKAVPQMLTELLTVNTEPNSSLALTSLNFPLEPPPMANLTVSFIAPPQYVITLKVIGSSRCPPNTKSYLEIRDPYVGKNGLTHIICHLKESTFPSYSVVGDGDDNGRGGGGRGNNNDGRNYRNNGNGGTGNNHRLMKNDDIFELVDRNNDAEETMGGDNGISLGKTFRFRSRFNRLDVKQVYMANFHGAKWNAQILTTLDENFREEVIADGDRLLLLNACTPNPCSNGGTCVTDKGRHICRCPAPFAGPFCALNLCDLNPCLFGECVMEGKTFKCKCQLGYGGERCERRYKPCDDRPCSGHGDCIEVNKTSYKCLCHAWWEGPQCESRMLHIPYKPLSQRMIEEPFWLGLITVFVVMGVIGLIWCLKRHFPEKLEKFLSEDLERNRGISWAPSSVRTGGVVGPGPLGIRDAIPGTSQQAASPPTTRSFLGRLGIRKPSLLSLSSATSNVSATVASPHTYENRTFSLDDLLRPSRGMLRTPSPHRRRNYSVQVRRDPAEKQQILQQLVSPGPSSSFDGESKPATPKPTLAEIIQMSEKRLRLASQSSMQEPQPSTSAAAAAANAAACSNNTSIDSVTAETSFTTLVPTGSSMSTMSPAQAASAAATKAEKKVTFAHMLDKLAAGEMTSSSSCSDVSCGEESKIIVTVPVKPVGKKDRKSRFRRSKSYRSRTSEEDGAEISSSDTTPDPIFPPRFPLRICISPTNTSGPSICTTMASSSSATTMSSATLGGGAPPTSLSAKSSGGKMTKIASADSLLSLFRRFSGSSSAPPSPQYSENEESSAGATPLSTPSSPRNSQLCLRPPALLITSTEPSSGSNSANNNNSTASSNNNNNNTIELPVIDPFSLGPAPTSGWSRPSGSSTITLEVPMRDYCLSPIHEVPTPLPTPSHSPAHSPMMRRPSSDVIPMIKVQSSEDDESFGGGSGGRRDSTPENKYAPRKLSIPLISISVDGEDDGGNGNQADSNDNNVSSKNEEMIKEVKACGKMNKDTGKRKTFTGEPEVIPDVLINVPPDASLEGKPDQQDGSSSGENIMVSSCSGIDSGPGPPMSPVSSSSSQGRGKPRPPPLIFANEMLTSCSSKNSKDGSGSNESTSSNTSTSSGSSCSNSSCNGSSNSSSSGSSSGTNSSCSSAGSADGDGGCPTGSDNCSNINNNNNSESSNKVMPSAVPLLNVEFATPVSETLPKFVTSPADETPPALADKTPTIEVVSCLAIPHIWDCPLVPPMITINQSSEAESDSDTTVAKSVRRPNLNFLSPFACDTNRVPSESNLSTSGYSSMASPCASRCPSVSPLCSAEMDDYHHCPHTAHGNPNQLLLRRASLTPSTPKKTSPSPRRSSLNSGTPLMSFTSVGGGGGGLFDKRSQSEEKYEEDKKKLAEVDVETDSAFEIETDMECQNNSGIEMTGSNITLSPPEEHEIETDDNGMEDTNTTPLVTPTPPPTPFSHPPVPIYPEELKYINNLLQVPKKGFPKSRSLDINSSMINDLSSYLGGVCGGTLSAGNSGNLAAAGNFSNNGTSYARNQQLKALGPSLDSKLNSIEPFLNGQRLKNSGSKGSGITITLPLSAFPNKAVVAVHGSGNLIEIPEEAKDRRLSPVSSRSESPLSELSAVGRYAACPGSPLTDSDGMYDCPSSEVPSNNNESTLNIPRLVSLNKLSPQQQLRRSGRRKDRRLGKNKPSNSAISVPNINTTSVVATAAALPPPLIPSPVVYRSPTTPSPTDITASGYKLSTSSSGVPSASTVFTAPLNVSGTDTTAAATASVVGGEERHSSSNQLIFPHIDLPPSLARESLVPVVAINKRASPKRRVRAQPALDVSSSSSAESLSSRSRSRTSVSSYQQACSSPKRSLEEVETTYALSDSAIGKQNSISDVVSSSKEVAATTTALEDDCIPGTSKKMRESSPKPDVIQQQPTSSGILLSPRSQGSTGSPARRKISKLRTISHQIRFLRRLELSLIRKKECLTSVNRTQEILSASKRHESYFARSDSWDTSREEDMSDSTVSTSDNDDNNSGKDETDGLLKETEKPLMSRSSSSPGTLCYKGPSNRAKPKGTTSGSSKLLPMDLLDNCSAAELLSSHKRRLRKYK